MLIQASLKQPEIVRLLETLSFKNLRLKQAEGSSSTYTYTSFDLKKVQSALGPPNVSSDGKVFIYEIQGMGKVGFSKDLVRFIEKVSKFSETGPYAGHLAKTEVSKELSLMFLQAAASPTKRLGYMRKLFDFFNQDKFGSRLTRPELVSTATKPDKGPGPNTRAYFAPGPNYTAKRIWVNPKLFNAREPFFLEIFLHEMCHQAVTEINKVHDRTEKGHGPDWQAWMKKVGLDPRRFDPTDQAEYEVGPAKFKEEDSATDRFGHRQSNEFWERFTRATDWPLDLERHYLLQVRGRALFGRIVKRTGTLVTFVGSPITESLQHREFTFRNLTKSDLLFYHDGQSLNH